MSAFFSIITLILKLIGLWEKYLDHADTQRKAEAEKRRQELNAGVDDAKKAKTPEEAFAAQKRIVNNKP